MNIQLPSEQPEIPQPNHLLRAARQVVVEVAQTALFVIIIYTLVNLALPRYIVEGRSMQPAFDGAGDERVIVNRLEYLLGDPQRGDIVVMKNPDDTEVNYIKRILGLPGEEVHMRNGQVFINGQPIDEPYIPELCHRSRCTDRAWSLGPNEYFVLGDNRNASHDSVVFGPIDRSLIVGRAWINYWPPQDWQLFEHFDYGNLTR